MMRKIYLLTFILGISLVNAQKNEECGTEKLMEKFYQRIPKAKNSSDRFNRKLSEFTKTGKSFPETFSKDTNQIYEIPIVVHVVSDGSALGTVNNRSDQQIIDWIDYTNDVLLATASGMANENNGGAIVPVKLVLAKTDPNCNATNGINRIDLSDNAQYVSEGVNAYEGFPGVPESIVLEKGKWDPTKYYNIYVVHELSAGTVVANGYAYYPSGYSTYDHSFMRAQISDVGYQTMPHELGHALGLMHTHEGSSGSVCPNNSDCTLYGDMVCDTEPIISLYHSSVFTGSCLTGNINKCTNQPYNGGEKNVMSYTSCFRDRFTPGQRERAISHLLEYRQSLLSSPVNNSSIINNDKNVLSACTPSGTAIPTPIDSNIGISYVGFGDINNYSDGLTPENKEFYKDYTKNYCLGVTNTSIPIDIPTQLTVKTGFEDSNHNIKVYIDYNNNNGIFDVATETVLTRNNAEGFATSITANIKPPTNAVTNTPLRMRVIADLANVTISPCYLPSYGQVEDYAVTIMPSLSTQETNKNIANITKNNLGNIFTSSKNSKIASIKIFDISGRILYSKNNISKKEFSVSKSFEKQSLLIVTVTLENNETISKKIKF